MRKLTGKVALITGASRGIGAAVAKRFAEEGAELILTARNVSGLEETDDAVRRVGGSAMLVPLDLREFGKIDQLAVALAERYGKLDILVGNAGALGVLTPLAHAEEKLWNNVIETNLTANWRLLRALDPLLQKSKGARAIFVSSGAAKAAFAYWGPYAVSKAGLEMLVRVYAAEQASGRVQACLLDPGIVATAMRKSAFPGEDPATLTQPEVVAELFLQIATTHEPINGLSFSMPD